MAHFFKKNRIESASGRNRSPRRSPSRHSRSRSWHKFGNGPTPGPTTSGTLKGPASLLPDSNYPRVAVAVVLLWSIQSNYLLRSVESFEVF